MVELKNLKIGDYIYSASYENYGPLEAKYEGKYRSLGIVTDTVDINGSHSFKLDNGELVTEYTTKKFYLTKKEALSMGKTLGMKELLSDIKWETDKIGDYTRALEVQKQRVKTLKVRLKELGIK